MLPRLLAAGVKQVQLPLHEPFNNAHVQVSPQPGRCDPSNRTISAQPGIIACADKLDCQHEQPTSDANDNAADATGTSGAYPLRATYSNGNSAAMTCPSCKHNQAAITCDDATRESAMGRPSLSGAEACSHRARCASGAAASAVDSYQGASDRSVSHAGHDRRLAQSEQPVSWLLRTEPASGCVTTAEAAAR